jgi:drug/metabolite transporter (DMT)-like permease
MSTEQGHDQSVSALVSGIGRDVQTLLRQEIALARTELRADLQAIRNAGGALALGSGLLAAAAILLLLALAQMLADLLDWPPWAGSGVVGLALTGLGYGLLAMARRRIQRVSPIPEQTVDSVKEQIAWLKDRVTGD